MKNDIIRYVFSLNGELNQYLDLTNFRLCVVALSPFATEIPYGYNSESPDSIRNYEKGKLAIASDTHLIITDKNVNTDDNKLVEDDEYEDGKPSSLQTVLEFQKESGRCTVVVWLAENIICLGFESGDFACFDVDGTSILEHKSHESSVVSIKLSPIALDGCSSGPGVWILYEGGMLISVPLHHILAGNLNEMNKFKFIEKSSLNDFVFLQTVYYSSIFESARMTGVSGTLPLPSHSVLVSGINASLSLYNIGGTRQFQHLGKFAGYVKEKVGSAITKTFTSIFGFNSSNKSNSDLDLDDSVSSTMRDENNMNIKEKAVSSLFDFDDPKRRILRITIDPSGKYVATADSLGRVTLFDTRLCCIIRVFKGVRDARLSWSGGMKSLINSKFDFNVNTDKSIIDENNPNINSHITLAIAIYAPQIGILSLYGVRLGRCLRSIGVGTNCQIFTIYETNLNGISVPKCCLARTIENHLVLSTIDPFSTSIDDIDLTAKEINENNDNNNELNSNNNDVNVEDEDIANFDINDTNMTDIIDERNLIKFKYVIESWLKFNKNNIINSTKPQDSLSIKDLEDRLLVLIKKIYSFKYYIIIISLIDLLERDGKITDSSTTILNQSIRSPSTSSSSLKSSTITVIFSVAFHNETYNFIKDKIIKYKIDNNITSNTLNTTTNTNCYNQLYKEMIMRIRLLSSYETLIELYSTSNFALLSTLSDYKLNSDTLNNEEISVLSSQKTLRSESLCWSLYTLNKLNPSLYNTNSHLEAQSPNNQIVSNSGRLTISPLTINNISKSSPMVSDNNRSRGNSVTSLSSVSPKSPSIHSSTRVVKNLINITDEDKKEKTPINNKISSLIIDKKQDNEVVSFSIFRSFFHLTTDIINNQDHNYSKWIILQKPLLSILSNQVKKGIKVDDINTIVNIDNILCLIDNNENKSIEWNAKIKTIEMITTLLFSSLLGDVFSLHDFMSITGDMNINGGMGLYDILPIVIGLIECQSFHFIISNLIMKQLTSSPFQRWLRDSLLSIQDDYSAYFNEEEDDNEGGEEEEDNDIEISEKEERFHFIDLINRVTKSLSSNDKDNNISRSNSIDIPPTYDELIRYVLRPAWLYIRQSSNLEIMMTIASLICETLQAVSEQIERRTYGQCTLSLTIIAWNNCCKQLRVALLLSNRSKQISIQNNKSTNIFNKNDKVPITVENLSSGITSIYSVLANDTLCFTLKSDQAVEHENRCQEVFNKKSTSSTSTSSSIINSNNSDNKALLAYGPTADKRWRELLNVVENDDVESDNLNDSKNTSSPKSSPKSDPKIHNKSSPSSSSSSSSIKRRRPLLLFFPFHNQPSALGANRSIELADRWSKRPSKINLLSLSSNHLSPLPSQTRAAVSEYICQLYIFPLTRIYLDMEENSSNKLQETKIFKEMMLLITDVILVKEFAKTACEILFYCDNNTTKLVRKNSFNLDNNNNNNDNIDINKINYNDEVNLEIWPPCSDSNLNSIIKSYLTRNGCNSTSIKLHATLFWILQLRTQCGLRCVKFNELFDNNIEKYLCINNILSSSLDINITSKLNLLTTNDKNSSYENIKLEFLLQCFRRLNNQAPNSSIIYKIGDTMGYTSDKIKLIHINALLERDASDDVVVQLLPDIKDTLAAVDNITNALRLRLGTALARIDRIPMYGALISSIDADAYQWVRNSCGPPDPSLVEDIIKNRILPLTINLPSTRHLVIQMQGILLNISTNNNHRDKKWMEKKGKVDSLLSICNEIQQWKHQNNILN